MRTFLVVLLLAPAIPALAQEEPSSSFITPSPAAPPPGPAPPGAYPPLPPPPPPPTRFVSFEQRRRWTGARVMNGFATVIGLGSAGLSLASAIYIAANHYPPSLDDFTRTPRPSDPAQILSFVASGTSALAFALSAGGLALRHNILRELDADTGRGLLHGGSVVGLLGIVSIAASYAVGFSDVANPHDRTIAVLSTSLGGAALCTIATAIFAKDASNLQKRWQALTTF